MLTTFAKIINNKYLMKKILNISRIISFAMLLLSSIPLVVKHFQNQEPDHALITHLHVIFGLLFILTAIPSMILRRTSELKSR